MPVVLLGAIALSVLLVIPFPRLSFAAAGGGEPRSVYQVTFVTLVFTHPFEDLTDFYPSDSTVEIEFIGACDSEGPCTLGSTYAGAADQLHRLEGLPFALNEDGSYVILHSGPESLNPDIPHCGMTVTYTLAMAISDGEVVGTYSFVPENGGVLVDPDNPNHECYSITSEYAFEGTLARFRFSDESRHIGSRLWRR